MGTALTKPALRRTQAERRAESERRVLDAAARVIAARGVAAASFAEIADEAGCSRSLPQYLFGSKVALLQALASHATAEFFRLLNPRLEGRRGLSAITVAIDLFIRSLKRPWPLTRAIYALVGNSLGGSPELRDVLNEHHHIMRDLFATHLEEGIESAEIRADVDVAAHAALLVGIMRGVGLQQLSDPHGFDLDSVTDEVVASVHRSLAA